MIALLALAAAAGWGTSDFAAGVASRRSTAMSVVILTHLTAVVVLVVVSVDPSLLTGLGVHVGRVSGDGGGFGLLGQLTIPSISIVGAPQLADLVWGLLAGCSGGFGALFLYQGLAKGSMAVVAPITAAGAAAIPALFGLATGDPASPVVLGGIVLALTAITLISSASGEPPSVASAEQYEGTDTDTESADERLVQRAVEAIGLIAPPSPAPAPGVQSPVLALGVGLAAATIAGFAVVPIGAAVLGPNRPPDLGTFLAAFGAVVVLSARATGLGLPERRARRVTRPFVTIGAPGVPQALLSGVGFALFFILSARTGPDAGLWPMVSARGASVVMFSVAAITTRSAVLPVRGNRLIVVGAGVLDAAAAGLFLVATRSGSLSVVSVLSSMYPAMTVILARMITKERCSHRQLLGLGLAAAAVGLIAAG